MAWGNVSLFSFSSCSQDSKLVIEKHKTGFHPPGDISFEDLSQSMENHNTPTQRSNNTPRTVKEKGTYGPASAGKNKKPRGGFKGLFSKSKVLVVVVLGVSVLGRGVGFGSDDFFTVRLAIRNRLLSEVK